jgi:hypothetical protein
MSRTLLGIALLLGFSTTLAADEPTSASPTPAMRQAPAVRVARLVDQLNTRSDTRRSYVPVFRNESEFVGETANAPHHQTHFHTDRYGYTPTCRCDNDGFADGLWAGYCETRRTSWYSNWMLGRWRNNCSCGDCLKSDK